VQRNTAEQPFTSNILARQQQTTTLQQISKVWAAKSANPKQSLGHQAHYNMPTPTAKTHDDSNLSQP
jgi:hypothetical protein